MNVKTDTKEKFTVITPEEIELSENMSGEIARILLEHLQKDIANVVLNLKNVATIGEGIATLIAEIQQKFYENSHSFVICELNEAIETQLDKLELLEIMNITPTESEAWDIVQMEEIERELLDGDDWQ